MIREILFKGKRVDNNQWMEGFLSFIYTDGRNSNGFIYTNKAQIYSPVEVRSHDVYTSTVGQFTGLTDKNGKKIFEGDVIRCIANSEVNQFISSGTIEVMQCDYVVVYKEKSACGFYYLHHVLMDTVEVIGNIHDTPALAKEESE